MNSRLSAVLLLVLCHSACAGNNKDHIGAMMSIPDETQRIAYVRALATNEVWVMASQAFDKGWDSYSAGAILAAYFGDNWERNTPDAKEVAAVIGDRSFSPRLRGALAGSGFEISRAWKTEDKIQYFGLVTSLLGERDITATEKTRVADYSYRAFERCLSEVRSLSDTNAMKSVYLNECHTRARDMMKSLSAIVEDNPKEQVDGTMMKLLEDYASTYEHRDFPDSPKLQGAIREADKVRSLLRHYRKK
jgi:hypothetical protein